MQRREFLAGACLAGAAGLNSLSAAQETQKKDERDYYELRKFHIETQEQKKLFDSFMRDAAIAAYNRIEINPVGVFYPMGDLGPIYVLLRYKSLESFATATQRLLADKEFLQKGAAFLDAPASSPAYQRIESSLMAAFASMPRLETPVSEAGRIFQLRIYESASVKAGQKKIEMFNTGEVKIFRKTGLHPVFFGENLTGAKMPNLTYMLVFRNMDESRQSWGRFAGDPEWKELRAVPEYADERIVSNITNIFLRPAEYSQI